MKLGDTILDFRCVTDKGPIESLHKWIGEGNWMILFSHPGDFTPVCTTELARALIVAPEFQKRSMKMLGISCDTVDEHKKWIPDICAYAREELGFKQDCNVDTFPFPIIADDHRELAYMLDMLDPREIGKDGLPLTARTVFIIGPDKTLRAQILYPATTGRDFNEILRVVDSLQMADRVPIATPEGWRPSQQCMIEHYVNDDQAKHMFGGFKKKELPSGKNYLRFIEQPAVF